MGAGNETARVPLLGRVSVAREPKTVRAFGSCATVGVPFAGYPLTPDVVMDTEWGNDDDCPPDEERLFVITSYTSQILRVQANGPFAPLPRSQVDGKQTIPNGVRTPGRSVLALRITLGGAGGERVYEVDAGQSLPVWARYVKVQGLMPGTMVEVIDDGDVAAQGNTVADATLKVIIKRVENYPGRWENTLTRYLSQAAAAAAVGIPIPPGAVTYEIAQNEDGNASVEWRHMIGDPATANNYTTSVIPWIPGARKTEPIERCPHASHLVPDVDLLNARGFTARFQVRP